MFKRLLLIALLLLPLSAHARQVIVGGGSTTIVASTNAYANPMGYIATYAASDATAYAIIPTGGTLDLLAFKSNGTLIASVPVTLYLNGSPTSLTASVSGTTPAHDSTHSVAVVAGDKVSMLIATPAGVASRAYDWSLRFTPTISGESILLGNSLNTAPAANQFVGMANSQGPNSSNATIHTIPELGTFKKFYVELDSDPTIPTSTVTFTVFNNGGAGNNTCTVTALGALSCNDTTHTDTVSTVGNPFNIKVTTATSPTLSPFHWGIVYVSPTAGNFLMLANTNGGATSASGARNICTSGSRTVNTGTQSLISNAFTAKQVYSRLVTAPGAGKSWDFSLQIGGVDTALLVNIADTNTKGGTTTDVTVSLDDRIQFTQNPNTGTPTTSVWMQTLVGNLADPVVGGVNTSAFMMFAQ